MTEASERTRVAGEIAATLHELEKKAHQADLGILAHLIHLARLEADSVAD